jgi:hypothetical protein
MGYQRIGGEGNFTTGLEYINYREALLRTFLLVIALITQSSECTVTRQIKWDY